MNAESFRPIFNPNIGLKPTAQKLTAIRTAATPTTTSTTVRPLTTISATLKSRVSSLTKQHVPAQQAPRSPVKPLSSPAIPRLHPPPPPSSSKPIDSTVSETKDAPVAEALRGDPYYRRGYYRRPYYYPSNNLYYNTRSRRRPNPKPYYAPSSSNYGYSSPYEDYRFETDFLDQSGYAPKSKKKTPTLSDSGGKDYMGVIDTDIGQFYDSQSATYNVPPLKSSYDQSGGYYSSGAVSAAGGSNSQSGYSNYAYSDYSDLDEYKYSTSKPKTNYKVLPSRAPIKQQTKTRTKYNSYDDNDYRYGSDSGGYGSDMENSTPASLAKYNNVYLPQHTVYQTAPKSKPKPKPKPTKTTTTTTTTTTTYRPPIKYSDTSIDVLTKPLGSATFNLNLSPGTVYSPPSINYNPIQPSYKSIPIQPPATSYGIPIAPPINNYPYQNSYSNQFNGYPPSNNNGFVNPSQISITNPTPRIPGQFAEPPPLNQVQLSNVDINYNSLQTSYDATPKQPSQQPPKRKPAKVNSKRVSTKPPPLNTDEELVVDDDQNDYSGESYSYFKTVPQPSLPNTYDQEEFHTVKNKRKQAKQSTTNEQTRHFAKKSKQPIEVTLRIPDEDYLDDLVKVVQTTKRPKKKSKQTTSHVLDTEDLRDAYDHNAAYYPSRAKKNKSHTRYQNMQNGDYDNYDNDDDDDTLDEDYDNDRVSHVTSKEHEKIKTHHSASNTDQDQDPVEPRYWDKSSSIYKQYGIRARNDNFPAGSSHEIYSGNSGFRPIRKNEHADIYAVSSTNIRPSTYVRDIAPNFDRKYSNDNRIASTLRTVTTTTAASTQPPTTLYVWDGKELPKNHKLI